MKKNGDFITVKPSRQQLTTSIQKTVCGSFSPIYYSKAKDSPETVKEIREHNAALGTFKCPKR